MRQKKKKLNIQKILFFILFIISAVYCINRYTVNTNINQSLLPNSINNSNYKIINTTKGTLLGHFVVMNDEKDSWTFHGPAVFFF